MQPQVEDFEWNGRRLAYEVHGEGPRVFVFIHGLLLDAALNRTIARRLAVAGNRVILPELLGHGRSDRPVHATEHRGDLLAEQVVALLDHLEIREAVVGGVSLGANVTLQAAALAPERMRALVVEMPVLERGSMAGIGAFYPMLLALRYGGPLLRPFMRALRFVPRIDHPVDAFLNLASSDPRELAAVLHGLLVGPGFPTATERRTIETRTLVIGHRGDLLHPMNDATALAAELPNAELVQAWSVLEARTFPGRITTEIARFLDRAWSPVLASDRAQA